MYYENGGSKLKEHELDSYDVFGLNVGYNWRDTVSLCAGMNNLFNKTILRAAGTYNEPLLLQRPLFVLKADSQPQSIQPGMEKGYLKLQVAFFQLIRPYAPSSK
ncbi:hypothetical protein [Eikenella exigua]|uniref:hypothetical protein n=1 Tax=Eikenella exigua TaxID=2528037 RepID=UPI0031FBBB55